MQLLIYATHLLALYCTASTVIATLGTRLIRTVRLLFSSSGNLADDEMLALRALNDKLRKGGWFG